tara:strand:- start:575 stop:769 length:195 start_codon:yes stop_codon:yes gene_type:complete
MKKEYIKEDINAMREALAESEYEGLRDRDIRQILWDGCLGWAMIDDDDIVEQYEDVYGEYVTVL